MCILGSQTPASRSFYKNVIAVCTYIYVSRSLSKCHLKYFKNLNKFQTIDEVNFDMIQLLIGRMEYS